MSDNLPEKADGRSVAFLHKDKKAILEGFLNGDKSLRELHDSGALKLTNREKAILVRSPEFLDLFDAVLFDAVFGIRELTKGQQEALKTLQRRLADVNNRGSASVEIKTKGRPSGPIQINVAQPVSMIDRKETDRTIKAIAEARKRGEQEVEAQQDRDDEFFRKLREQGK